MYEPGEDSELLSEALKKFIKKEKPEKISSFLDMGCGSGFQSKIALELGVPKNKILAVDIDEEALEKTRRLGVKTIKSDLFENVKGKFDLIAFNPPYLPEDVYDKEQDTTGGEQGWETIARFLGQAASHLEDKGRILLLFSSITNKDKIKELVKDEDFVFKEIAKEKWFMEELKVWLLTKDN